MEILQLFRVFHLALGNLKIEFKQTRMHTQAHRKQLLKSRWPNLEPYRAVFTQILFTTFFILRYIYFQFCHNGYKWGGGQSGDWMHCGCGAKSCGDKLHHITNVHMTRLNRDNNSEVQLKMKGKCKVDKSIFL